MLNWAASRNLAAIRFSWRLRRKSRLAGKEGQLDGIVGTGHGRDTEKPSVHGRRLDRRPRPAELHPIPERFESQRGRKREPPVIIGDPTVSLFSAFERKTAGKVMTTVHADVLHKHRCVAGYGHILSREHKKVVLSRVSPTGRGQSCTFPDPQFHAYFIYFPPLPPCDENLQYTPQVATSRSSRQSTRHSTRGPDDIPSRASLDLRTIPLIPQEDSDDDMMFALSPGHSQSPSPSQSPASSHSNTPTRPSAHTLFPP